MNPSPLDPQRHPAAKAQRVAIVLPRRVVPAQAQREAAAGQAVRGERPRGQKPAPEGRDRAGTAQVQSSVRRQQMDTAAGKVERQAPGAERLEVTAHPSLSNFGGQRAPVLPRDLAKGLDPPDPAAPAEAQCLQEVPQWRPGPTAISSPSAWTGRGRTVRAPRSPHESSGAQASGSPAPTNVDPSMPVAPVTRRGALTTRTATVRPRGGVRRGLSEVVPPRWSASVELKVPAKRRPRAPRAAQIDPAVAPGQRPRRQRHRRQRGGDVGVEGAGAARGQHRAGARERPDRDATATRREKTADVGGVGVGAAGGSRSSTRPAHD